MKFWQWEFVIDNSDRSFHFFKNFFYFIESMSDTGLVYTSMLK